MQIRLFKVGRVWHYRFQINGTRVQRSTHETTKRIADEIAQRAYRHAKLWARGDEPVPTLRHLVSIWIDTHKSIVSSDYVRLVETFGRLHLYDLSDILADELTTDKVEEALIAHRVEHAPATVNHWLTMLKVVCKWAVRRRIMPEVPWSIPTLKVQKKPRATLPQSRAVEWLAVVDRYGARRPCVSIGLRLMFGLGLRESEVITARWEWFDADRETYTPGVTKGREALPLPVPPWLITYLAPYRKPDGLIVSATDGKELAPGFTRRAMEAANAVCGTKRLTPHRLRGTYATMLSEHGLPIQTIQRLLRHKDPMTTMGYLESNLESAVLAQAAVAKSTGMPETTKPSGEEVANTNTATRTT